MLGVRPRPRGATLVDRILPWGSRRRNLAQLPLRASRFVRDRGWAAFGRAALNPSRWVPLLFRRADPAPSAMTPVERYLLWSSIHHRNPRLLRRKRRQALRLRGPTISVLVPVHDPDARLLSEAIASVRSQLYPGWELVLVDDASSERGHLQELRSLARSDARIKVLELGENLGISGATNHALVSAEGAFVAMMDQDDALAPDALYEVAALLARAPELDLVYTDEEKVDEDGRVLDVFFKPAWSPDLELSTNYVNHLTVVRTETLRGLGGLRSEFDGAQDYDTVLRVTEITSRVGHVALPLYSWRSVAGSMSESLEAKPWAYEAGTRALQDSVTRRAPGARVEAGSFPGAYDARWPSPERNAEIHAIVDAPGGEPSPELIAALKDAGAKVSIVSDAGEGWARSVNAAAGTSETNGVLLLTHGDVIPETPGWLERLLEHASHDGVAAVGPGIMDAIEGSMAGVVIWARRPAPGPHAAYRPAAELARTVSAVSGVCMMLRGSVFRALEGLDEGMGPGASEVDLCLRAAKMGFRSVVVPRAAVRHDPSEPWRPPHADARFRARWKGFRDPYYNPRFDLDEPYVLRI